MAESLTLEWNGLKLAATFKPSDRGAAREPCFVVLHGFGSTKDSGSSPEMSGLLNSRGYATLRVDMPGCGDSEGERGRHVCLDQVAVAKACVDYLLERPDVDGSRIGMAGASFGAAISIYTAGEDERVAAVISSGGWGSGERKAKLQHPPSESWEKFTNMLAEGREKLARGEVMMVPRYDIVPIPEHLSK
ncbi:MAG: alpha/beta fold hydrolase, partial [Rhodospirillales bacterium]|nr:alpha/beta fold hydrolase [Rhodospirillales bacterium]